MRRLSLLALCGLPLLALSPACRSGDDGGSSDGGGTHDGSNGSDGSGSDTLTTIEQVQDDSNAAGSNVELTGVVVTAIDAYGSNTGDFWVQDPNGGSTYAGVHVYHADVSDVAALSPGDIINISGAIKAEFAYSSDTSGQSETEIEPASGGAITITKTGTGEVPAPVVVDALAIGQMTDENARYAAWEPTEGMLITIENVAALSSVSTSTSDSTNQYFHVTGDIEPQSSMAAFPTGITSGQCFASITGIQSYFSFNTLIYPRTTDDVGGTGTNCPAPENTSALCTDSVDNDGNGFADCDDNACIVNVGSCHPTTTITAIQASTPTGGIEIDNVYVTGIAHNGTRFWVSTNPAAAVNEGVYVFNSQTLPTGVVQGSKVTIIGKVQEYNDDANGGTLTEVTPLSMTFDNTSPATIVPVTTETVAQLLDSTTASMYESVLVTLTNVNITAVGSSTNGYVATAKQSGTTFGVGTDIIQLTAAQEGCYASITGFWTNLQAPSSTATTKPNAFGFIPLTLGASGSACN